MAKSNGAVAENTTLNKHLTSLYFYLYFCQRMFTFFLCMMPYAICMKQSKMNVNFARVH